MHALFIVDGQPIVRQGYVHIFGANSGFALVGATGSAREARRAVPEADPDLTLLGLNLAEGSGLELIKDLHARDPDHRMLVISGHDEHLYAERAVRAGALGYLEKGASVESIRDAARTVATGRVYLSPALNKELILRSARDGQADTGAPVDVLSDRELEVYELMGTGQTRREIARTLSLSPKTIDTHRGNIKEKMSIDTNEELRREATVWVETYISG
jgi:DNA-binding NarL/FixJ family response regulator